MIRWTWTTRVALGLWAALALVACGGSQGGQGTGQAIAVAVTDKGFEPSQTKVKVGQPVTLTLTRSEQRTCATEIIIEEYGINQALPLNTPVKVTFTPTKAGQIRYACAMNMIGGELTAE